MLSNGPTGGLDFFTGMFIKISSAMSIMEEIDRKMIIVYNARKRMKQISALLDVLEEKVDAC